MAENHLSNDEFFSKLTLLLQSTQTKGHGSVFLTQKRLSYGQNNEAKPTTPSSPELFPDQSLTSPLPIIIHATNGNLKVQKNGKWVATKTTQRKKLSTVVQPNDLDAFFVRYAEVCKAGMASLKKRDRSKKKRKEKKKKGTEGGKG